MEDERRDPASSGSDDDYVKGGKGRKDEVGGSGIYPASAPNAPADAEVRSEGELGGRQGPRRKPTSERTTIKSDQSSGSE
jgi:hypothetical protein